jgi:hypothetical protein
MVPLEELELHQARQAGRALLAEFLAAFPQCIDVEIGRADRIVVIDLLGFGFARGS